MSRKIPRRGRLEASTHDLLVHRSLNRIGDPAALDKWPKRWNPKEQASQAHARIVTRAG